MYIIIQRTKKTQSAIEGTLHINGQHLCNTAENRPTALPAGKYRIIRHYCHQYQRFMPMILTAISDEPRAMSQEKLTAHCSLLTARCKGCSPQKTEDKEVSLNTTMPCYCPMLKPGNGVHHREDGSIILGTQVIPDCLIHPLETFEPLAERIRKATSRGKEVTLIIKNSRLTCHPEEHSDEGSREHQALNIYFKHLSL